MDKSMFNLFSFCKCLHIAFKHRSFSIIKASRLIHIIPYLNIFIHPYVIILIITILWNFRIDLFKIISCLWIKIVIPNSLFWPAFANIFILRGIFYSKTKLYHVLIHPKIIFYFRVRIYYGD